MQEKPTKIRQEYYQSFQNILASLNEQQRQAVLQTEGPVLALAGPGTGKTHILSARIGQILLSSDTKAFNILCLTFTDAAVHAMRKRLLTFIGPEAHRVHIYTFHSFCNKVIQENLELFGRYDLEPLSDLERIEILRNLLQDLDIEHPLKVNQRDIFYYEKHLQHLFKQMKAERWSVDYLQQLIEEYLTDLPQRPEMIYKRKSGNNKAGDLKKAIFRKRQEQMKLLGGAIELFPKYEAALAHKKRYDYEDMILWVVEAFEKEAYLLQTYQEQYLYFLVDEFQDTNGSQSAILQKLVAYWGDNPNLFVVGDDDQSIYEFQGARVKNMSDFYSNYEQNLLLVLLQKNYRSTQQILDASKSCIDNNTIRIIHEIDTVAVDKTLQAANLAVSAINTAVELVEYPNKLQEEVAIIQQIEALKEKGVPLQNIALIYAVHRQSNNIIRLLDKRNIPYQTKRKINVLELPIISNLRKLMAYIVAEYKQPYSGENIFFEFLHYDFVGLSPSDTNKLTAWAAKETQKQLQLRAYDALPKWHDTIRNAELLEQLQLENSSRLLAFAEFLNRAIYQQKNGDLLKLFELIINQSGLIQFVANSPQKIVLTQVLGTLFEFIRQEKTKNKKLDLEGFLNLLNQLESNNIALGLFQVNPAADGVNLLTAHAAKGLEFEYVFIINANKDYWEPKKKNSQSFSFPDNFIFSNESDAYEASRRLFYVAMTRAKKQLQISYFKETAAAKEKPRACFVDELLLEDNPAIHFAQKEALNIGEWQFLLLSETEEKPLIKLLATPVLQELLRNFKLSVSALNNYLYCPLGFYYEYVLKVPSFSSKEAAYGTAIHHTLKRIFDQALKSETKELPSTEKLLEIFEFELKKQAIFLAKNIFANRLELGKRHLPQYYQQRKNNWTKLLQTTTILTEKPLKNVAWEGIPLTGTIDKMIMFSHQNEHLIEIVDYKTGKLNEKRLKKPTLKNPTGGVYWRQLVFYKILIENAKSITATVKTASIDYLTPDIENKFPQKSMTFTETDVQQVGDLIKQSYQNIMAHKFDTGCNKPSCKWCDFAKNNMIPASFSNEKTEELDDK